MGEGDEPYVLRARRRGVIQRHSTNEAPNKGGRPLAEGVEERPLTEENTGELDLSRAQNRTSKPHRPDHVREAALNRVRFHAPLRGRNRVR